MWGEWDKGRRAPVSFTDHAMTTAWKCLHLCKELFVFIYTFSFHLPYCTTLWIALQCPGILADLMLFLGWVSMNLCHITPLKMMKPFSSKIFSHCHSEPALTSAPSTGCPLLLSCEWSSTELIFGFTLVTNSVGNRSCHALDIFKNLSMRWVGVHQLSLRLFGAMVWKLLLLNHFFNEN